MLSPFITGFDHQAAQNFAQSSPELTAQIGEPLQMEQPLQLSGQGAPGPAGSALNWRREKAPAPLLLAATEPNLSAAPSNLSKEKVHSWETGEGKSYLIPALEVPAFLVLLNIFDRIALNDREEDGSKPYSSTFSSTWEHLRRQNWEFDTNPFDVNQFGHPYQGATMYGLARSTGLNFWESFVYSNVGSFLWEMAGETGQPSINDMATTGTSGSLLGEALFRMSALVLKEGGSRPDTWHEVGAAIVSPTTALNRHLFGDRFKSIFPEDPARFWRFRLGAALSGNSRQSATADFAIAYGLPGKRGYSYNRPLDYFDFQISGLSRSDNVLDSVLLRGLLYGKPYQTGDNHRGIWGLYGSYDYISPGDFRVSTTALSLGTTSQYWLTEDVALQGTLLGGVGFGGAGVAPRQSGDRDYHYGMTPQAIMAFRLLFGSRAALELVTRGYYMTDIGSDDTEGSERIVRAVANLNFRVSGNHGIGLQFVESVRDAHYDRFPDRRETDGTLSIVYTYVGDSYFGAVEWRGDDGR